MNILELLTNDCVPQKKFFQIAEVANVLNVKPHEIRHWETELPQIRPQRSKSGTRIYRREDVLRFFAIRTLVYDKKLTVAGAQRVLAQADEHFFASATHVTDQALVHIAQPHNSDTLVSDGGITPFDSASVHSDHDHSWLKVPDGEHRAQEVHAADLLLKEASAILKPHDDDDDFDDQTQEIYQRYGDDLVSAAEKPGIVSVSDVQQASPIEEESARRSAHEFSNADYEKALHRLTQIKESLLVLLALLDRYQASTWWQSFNHELEQSL